MKLQNENIKLKKQNENIKMTQNPAPLVIPKKYKLKT